GTPSIIGTAAADALKSVSPIQRFGGISFAHFEKQTIRAARLCLSNEPVEHRTAYPFPAPNRVDPDEKQFLFVGRAARQDEARRRFPPAWPPTVRRGKQIKRIGQQQRVAN